MAWRACSRVRDVSKLGIDSSLSSVPPVCPSPRPDIIGTATPRRDEGASTIETLSPTPPRGVLVDARLSEVAQVERFPAPQHRLGERVRLAAIEALEVARREERGHLVVGHVARGVRVGQRAELARLDAAVPLPLDQPKREH